MNPKKERKMLRDRVKVFQLILCHLELIVKAEKMI